MKAKTRLIAMLLIVAISIIITSCSNNNNNNINNNNPTNNIINITHNNTIEINNTTKNNQTAAKKPKFDFEKEYAKELDSIRVCNITDIEYYISNNFIYHEYATNISKHNYRVMSFIGIYTKEHNFTHWRLVPFVNKKHSIYNDTITWIKKGKMPNNKEIICYNITTTSKKIPYVFKRFIRKHIEPYIRFPMEEYWKEHNQNNNTKDNSNENTNSKNNSMPEIVGV